MSYDVQIVADSVAPHGRRITTFQLQYPMRVHWDLMTHRAFSRNASSGRAISVARMAGWVKGDISKPPAWLADETGMRQTAELPRDVAVEAESIWLQAADDAIRHAESLAALGVHRQDANALLIPFGWINVLVTATSFDNFFALRVDPAARLELQTIAVRMAWAYKASTPVERPQHGVFGSAWHLPYVTDHERSTLPGTTSIKLCVARCARVSYLTHEGTSPDPAKDIALHDQLAGNGHWSPFEHAACVNGPQQRSGNFIGWSQYRQQLNKSVHERFDYKRLELYGDRDFIVQSTNAGDTPTPA